DAVGPVEGNIEVGSVAARAAVAATCCAGRSCQRTSGAAVRAVSTRAGLVRRPCARRIGSRRRCTFTVGSSDRCHNRAEGCHCGTNQTTISLVSKSTCQEPATLALWQRNLLVAMTNNILAGKPKCALAYVRKLSHCRRIQLGSHHKSVLRS